MKIAAIIGSTAGLVGGNFIYQAMQTSPVWATAVDRSFFQVVAVAVLVSVVAIHNVVVSTDNRRKERR